MLAQRKITTRQLGAVQLITIATLSLACAGNQKANAELEALAQDIKKDDARPCLSAVEAARARDGERESFLRGKNPAFRRVLRAVNDRCMAQTNELIRHNYAAGAVDLLEAWQRAYPVSFQYSSRPAAQLQKHKPKADTQREQFAQAQAAYEAVDAKKYPAVAYLRFLDMLKVPARTPEQAASLMAEHDAWLKRLEPWRVLGFATRMDIKDPYIGYIFKTLTKSAKQSQYIRYDSKRPFVILDVKFGEVQIDEERERITMRHRYVTGSSSRKVAANPNAGAEAAKLQEQYNRALKSFQRTKCNGGGTPGIDCARGEKQSLDRLRERLERAGGKVGQTRTQTKYSYAIYEYPATRLKRKIHHKMTVTVSWPGDKERKPATLNYHPYKKFNELVHPEHWQKYRITKKEALTERSLREILGEFVADDVLWGEVLQRVREDYWVRVLNKFNPKWDAYAQANMYAMTFCVSATPLKEDRKAWFGKLSEEAQAILGDDKCPAKHLLPVPIQHKKEQERAAEAARAAKKKRR